LSTCIHLVHFSPHAFQTQLKDYDRDILQELWRIRNNIHSIKDVHKKVRREESRFIDESIEDRSPTPDFVAVETPQDQKHMPSSSSVVANSTATLPEPGSDGDEESPPDSPSPVQSPKFVSSEGDMYRTGTLHLMASAPNHLRQSSDEKVLEEFFGSDQVNRFFKSQTSLEITGEVDENTTKSVSSKTKLIMQGVSMPNINVAPSNSPLTKKAHQAHEHSLPLQGKPHLPHNVPQQQPQQQPVPQVQRRLQIPKNPNSDANRKSCDVASEMEKLRARLQKTAIQELAEFDRKYSPKLHHNGVLAPGGGGGGGGIGDGQRSGEVSLNHSRQGSLDSSMSSQPTSSTNLLANNHPAKPGKAGQGVGGGHTRQYSLPIDPNYYRQLQQEQSMDRTPNMSPRNTRPTGIVIGRKVSGSSFSANASPSTKDFRSPSPPPIGHVRQISGASAGSSENGATSPPLVVGAGFQFPEMASRGRDKGETRSKPPGMTRVSSNGSRPSRQHTSTSLSSSAGASSVANSNGNNRYSPENQLPVHSHTTSQPHYSTSALKRGKRNSKEISPEPGTFYQAPSHSNSANQHHHHGSSNGISRPLVKTQSYDEKMRAGYRPHTYEKLPGYSQPEAADTRGGGVAPGLSPTSTYQEHVAGGIGGARPPPHPRYDASKIPASPRMGRRPPAGGQQSLTQNLSGSYQNGKVNSDDIQPYMTSSQVKQQMKFMYTPFSNHQQQQQRSYSMSTVEPPRLQKKGSGRGSTSGRGKDQRTWI